MPSITAFDKLTGRSDIIAYSGGQKVIDLGVDDFLDVFDFTVEQGETTYRLADGSIGEHTGRKSLVRRGGRNSAGELLPDLALSTMGNGYENLNYRDHFTGVAAKLIDLGCTPQFIGTLDAGAKAFASFKLPAGVLGQHLGEEYGTTYFNMGDSVDGSSSNIGTLTHFTNNCSNFWASGIVGVPAVWKLRHTNTIQARTALASATLTKAIDKANAMQVAMVRMADTTYTQEQWRSLVSQLVGEQPDEVEAAAAATRWSNRVAGLNRRYNGDQITPAIQGSMLHALEAVQGWTQHDTEVRSSGSTPEAARSARNIGRTVFGSSADRMLTEASTILQRELVAA